MRFPWLCWNVKDQVKITTVHLIKANMVHEDQFFVLHSVLYWRVHDRLKWLAFRRIKADQIMRFAIFLNAIDNDPPEIVYLSEIITRFHHLKYVQKFKNSAYQDNLKSFPIDQRAPGTIAYSVYSVYSCIQFILISLHLTFSFGRYVSTMVDNDIIVELDFANVFNTLRWDILMKTIAKFVP